MYKLPPQQKQYLFKQHQETRAASMSKATSGQRIVNHAAQASTYSAASRSLVPQHTGDSGIMKRFSILGWGAPTTSPSHSPRSSVDVDATAKDIHASPSKASDFMPVQSQSTGGLWSSWWSSSGGEKGTITGDKKEVLKTPRWYVDGIRSGKPTDIKLVKHLISLRVHLSTADLVWIGEFVADCKGMYALGAVLSGLVAKGGKRKKLQNVEESVLLEAIKCIRVLLNTDVCHLQPFNLISTNATFVKPGFKHGLSDATLMTHLAYSLHGSSPKLRALTSDVLAAICYVSPTEGHKAVLSALSDYRVEYGEKFRFEGLIGSLRPPDIALNDAQPDAQGYGNDEEGAWEARTASMALVNAITNFPDSLEERILLREEFTRRGLNEVLVVSGVGFLSVLVLTTFGVVTTVYQAAGISAYSTGYLYRREVRRRGGLARAEFGQPQTYCFRFRGDCSRDSRCGASLR
jgi:diaphanous 1